MFRVNWVWERDFYTHRPRSQSIIGNNHLNCYANGEWMQRQLHGSVGTSYNIRFKGRKELGMVLGPGTRKVAVMKLMFEGASK